MGRKVGIGHTFVNLSEKELLTKVSKLEKELKKSKDEKTELNKKIEILEKEKEELQKTNDELEKKITKE